MSDDKNLPATFPGHRYWKAIQGSVDAILAPMGIKRKVISRGTQFNNVDAWTWLAFNEYLCDHLSKNPTRGPNRSELKAILHKANSIRCSRPEIRVAKMPERVNHRVALAIIGGGYHEAWHTKYSKRDRIRLSEVQPIVDMIDEVTLAGGKFDEKMRGLLTTLQHLVEDVRIERRGNEDFPGAIQPMRDLQDFILDLEAQARGQNNGEGAKVKNIQVTSNARSILLCAFRDLGFGYNTHKARAMLEYYKQAAPGAIALLTPGGLLAPMLHEATTLAADDKLGSMRVAMKIVIALWRATQTDKQEGEEDKPKLECPQCGAGPRQLVIRAARDESGHKIRGRAEMECKSCGFKHEFDLPDQSLDFDQNRPEADEDEERPEVEDLTQDDVDGGDGFGYDQREKMRERQREHEKQQEQGADDGAAEQTSGEQPEGEQSEGTESPDAGGSEEEGDESEKEQDGAQFEDLDPLDGTDEDDGDGGEGREEESDDLLESIFSGSDEGMGPRQHQRGEEDAGGAEGPQASPQEAPSAGTVMPNRRSQEEGAEEGGEAAANEEMSGEEFLEKLKEAGLGAGGLNLDLGRDPDSHLRELTEIRNVLAGSDKDGRIDGIQGLEQVMEAISKAETRDLKRGERPWNPYDPMLDEARIVRSNHKDDDLRQANEMLAEVRGTVTFLRSRLRMIVRAQEMTDTTHGVRRGRKMSSRTLVDTAVDLRSGSMPRRAYQVTDTQIDTSFALALCLDQSGSMWCRVREVAQCMMVMADAVEGIGGKTMAFGFRNGVDGNYSGSYDYGRQWHRVCGVRYDVFKMWEEKFANSKWRFAHTQATGSTPMADGVQFGLTSLNERREGHRVLAVITDGAPDSPHEQVIARQVRLAKAAGIHVIGVGIGGGAQYVKKLFPDSVWADKIEDLPQPLLKKLNELCDFQGRHRGKKANLDGKITRKVS